MFSLVRIAAFTLVIGQVYGLSVRDTEFHALLARQGQSIIDPDEVPDACQSQCAAISSSTCDPTDANCYCTETINKGLVSCINCINSSDGNTPDPSISDPIQEAIASYEDNCKNLGHPLSSLTVAGYDGSTFDDGFTSTAPGAKATTTPGAATTTAGSGSGSTGSSSGGLAQATQSGGSHLSGARSVSGTISSVLLGSVVGGVAFLSAVM